MDNFENHISKKTLDDIWGPVAIINPFRRKDFIFVEGYYSAFKILIKITKNEIPIEAKYLNDVDESKTTLINPIMFLAHHFIELSLKRYIMKLKKTCSKTHQLKDLLEILETLWHDADLQYLDSFWIEKGWLQGWEIKYQFQNIKKIISDLHCIDKKSTNFRYNDTLLFQKIDLNKLENKIDYLYDFFEDLNVSISFINDEKV